ncbi:MAG: arginase family protein [Lachnospiraceae bacterium]
MEQKIMLLNFHHEYQNYDFYKKFPYQELDFSQLQGVNGYCDEEARIAIQEKLDTQSICFMGNGNYHYISYLRIEKIREPFYMIVFDHHTDMQPSFVEELLSCGCWILWALNNQPFLQKVLLIGVKDELAEEISKEYQERVKVLRESELSDENYCMDTVLEFISEAMSGSHVDDRAYNKETYVNMQKTPVYVSVDKDVFANTECVTNWDAGGMTLQQFAQVMEQIKKFARILGCDVCGEPEEQTQIVQEQNGNDFILKQLL